MSPQEPIGPEAILDKKARHLIPCVYHFYRRPPQIVRGAGVHVVASLDESALASQTAALYGTDHCEVPIRVDEIRKAVRDSFGAVACNECQPTRIVVWIEDRYQSDQLVGSHRGTALESDRVVNSSKQLHVSAV